ncbi:MAG: thioredoxin domain-containing protein [Nitrospirota bacterium]
MKKSRLVIIEAAAIMVVFAALAYGQMKDISDQQFQQEVLSSPSPVMVEFWSPKCPHCLKMAKTVSALAKELNGRVKVAKINVLENDRMANKYGVQVIPTFLLFRNGKVRAQAVGEMDGKALKKELGI